MSNLRAPQGGGPVRRPSPAVYRRRRLAVLLGLIVVVAVVVVVVVTVAGGAPGGGAGVGTGAGATTLPVAPATTSPSTTPDAGTGASTGGSTPPAAATGAAASTTPPATSPPTTSPPAVDGSQACAAGNIAVTAVTDANSYSAGALPQLSFTIVNTGSQPCTINAGTSKQVYTITSGTEVYWKSTDCQTNPADTPAMLAPGKSVSSTPFAWNRNRSSPSTCDAAPVAVPAGGAAYHLTVTVDGIASAQSVQFLLY